MRNNRGINGPKDDPQDLPQEFLTELYNHFSEKAIRFPQLPSTLSQKETMSTADHTVIKYAHSCPRNRPSCACVFLPLVRPVLLDDPDASTWCGISCRSIFRMTALHSHDQVWQWLAAGCCMASWGSVG